MDNYVEEQIVKLSEELTKLQLSFDTRLLAAFLAGKAGKLFGLLIAGGKMSQEEAWMIWNQAAEAIENPPEDKPKVMAKYEDEIFDPDKTN